MGRKKYEISADDFEAAKAYLMRNHFAGKPWLKPISEPEKLQQFCDNELKPDEWEKLKTTIRQERKRGRDEAAHQTPKTITISSQAWKELNSLQCHLKDAGFDVNYSELIEAMAEKLRGKDARSTMRKLEIQKDLI